MATPAGPPARTPLAIAAQFWAWAALLRVLKHLLPLRILVRLVRTGSRRSRTQAGHVSTIVGYMGATGRFPARAPANCLERSLVAYRLLRAAGARPELHVGVRRLPDSGTLDGHVWLVLDGTAAAESHEFLRQFTPVLRVDADGRFESPAGVRPETQQEQLRSVS